MKTFKLLLITGAISSNLLALNISQAVETALLKNHDIKIEASRVEQAKASKSINTASFLPSLDLAYTFNKRDEIITGQTKEDSIFTASLSYNLFNGFKSIAENNSSNSLYEASKFVLEAKKFDTILDVKQRYINYLNNERYLKTREDALLLFEKQYKDTLNKYNQGLLAKNNLLQVEVIYLQAKQLKVQAKSSLDISKKSLSSILGGVDLRSENIEPLADIEKEVLFNKQALENRNEIKALKENIKSKKSLITSSRSSYLPTVDVGLSHNRFGNNASLNGRTGYPDSQNIATLSAKWNLFNGGSTHSLSKVYKNQLLESRTLLEQTRLNLQLQFDSAVSSLEVAKLNLKTSSLALEQAKLNYEIVNNRFLEGISTTADLIDANYLLTSAKQNYFSAFYSKYLSIETLNRIVEKN